ncbi:MerR family DNA-binding transcriptional regulator [Desulfitobacterium sp. LBE]|uniref:MerR family transcriptional regulator n=1 Tax=Desulfitobacterium sp. LBE TaxID=884086 RepID=UPI001FA94311|nr:MerR family DNA-binding transcriptional regulator [Desulfitobacterium sp. LBE]
MTLQPISKVSKAYSVSTRTLRYYEQLGLLRSSKLPGYAYRAYDAEAASLSPHVFEQEQVMKLVQALSIKTLSQKEETSMEELNRASEILEQLKDIRILYLPPMTVASC